MKKLATLLFSLIVLTSCEDIEVKNPRTNREFKSTSTPVKKDTVIVRDTISVKTIARYECKYPVIVSKILLLKRTEVLKKEERDISFYSTSFIDLYDVDKTHDSILKYYDKTIDTLIEKAALKGNIHYNNIGKTTGKIID